MTCDTFCLIVHPTPSLVSVVDGPATTTPPPPPRRPINKSTDDDHDILGDRENKMEDEFSAYEIFDHDDDDDYEVGHDYVFSEHYHKKKKEFTIWDWIVPAAIRPNLDIPRVRHESPTSMPPPPPAALFGKLSYSFDDDENDDHDDQYSRDYFDYLTTIKEAEGEKEKDEEEQGQDGDNTSEGQEEEEEEDVMSVTENSLYSIPKAHQLPPPEYFDNQSIPRAPSNHQDYDVDWNFFEKGMYNLPNPPSLVYDKYHPRPTKTKTTSSKRRKRSKRTKTTKAL